MKIEISVKKTLASDFEKIYPLLLAFDSPYSRNDWKRIFDYRWDGTEDHIGYHLDADGDVVGFMGLIFSCRYKNKERYSFCNITSLIVKPEYRAATLLLLRKLLTYQNTIFTGLGPIPESFRLMTLLGFSSFENKQKIIPVINGYLPFKKKISADISKGLINKLSTENKRIYLDHIHLKCKAILFEYHDEKCLLFYHVEKHKHFYFLIKKIFIHSISDVIFFNKHFRSILFILKKHFGLQSAIYMDARFIKNKKFLLSIEKLIDPPKIYNKPNLDPTIIDHLYSEVVLL